MQSTFKITEDQIEKIRPFMENLENYLKGSLGDFLSELNLVICCELDINYEDTPNSIMLQKVYDDIYNQNED